VSLLPTGPTAHFRLSSFVPTTKIKGHANLTGHVPEIILNQFTTRLGHRVGRFLGSMFPHKPEFVGRRVITFHNQRDFIFVRQHRYMIDDPEVNNIILIFVFIIPAIYFDDQ
jgi:ribosome production factor 1